MAWTIDSYNLYRSLKKEWRLYFPPVNVSDLFYVCSSCIFSHELLMLLVSSFWFSFFGWSDFVNLWHVAEKDLCMWHTIIICYFTLQVDFHSLLTPMILVWLFYILLSWYQWSIGCFIFCCLNTSDRLIVLYFVVLIRVIDLPNSFCIFASKFVVIFSHDCIL